MARRCFLSFCYDDDSWRVQQIKNIGKIEGQPLLSSNEWEKVKKGGDRAIENWISDQMKGKSCLVVLAGANTAGRRWVKHEIKTAFGKGTMGLLAIHIHNIKDGDGHTSTKGPDPFAGWSVGKRPLSDYAVTINPAHSASKSAYQTITENIDDWIEEAIKRR